MQPRKVLQFRQWRFRMKSVLDQTTEPISDESDLGPAVTTSRVVNVAPIELTSSRFGTSYPLRC
jgi:hypothetical protein